MKQDICMNPFYYPPDCFLIFYTFLLIICVIAMIIINERSKFSLMTKILVFITLFFIVPNVKGQNADFTFQSSNGLFCTPSTITFTQTSSGNPTSFIWDFGDGNFGSNATENYTYTSDGSYTVKLTAIYANSVATVSKVVVINPIVTVAVTADRDYICQPGVVNFAATSNSSIVNYEWSFGNPGSIESNKTNNISHYFDTYGVQNVNVIGTASTGCTASFKTTLTVKKLTISALASKRNGCVPSVVTFNANATPPKNSTVSSYIWDFADGSPVVTTTLSTVTKTYSVVGQYSPKVTAISNEGCTNTTGIGNLAFGSSPLNHVASVQNSTICGSETAVFKTTAINANRYSWDFGDGTTQSSLDTFITHKYTTIGKKTVIVRAFFNECSSASPITITVNIIGVIAKYINTNNCINKNIYIFNDLSNGSVTGRLWTYGDTSIPTDTTISAVHSYPISGQFVSKIFVTDTISGCSDSITNIVYTADPSLSNNDSAICKNTLTTFSILDNYTNPATQYTWNIVGFIKGPNSVSSITVNANKLGNFDNFVAINYGSGTCNDTVRLNHQILVKGPNLDFKMPASICINSTLSIINNSQPFIANESIFTYYWNYGKSNVKDTIEQPLPIKYNFPKTYFVKLIAKDINGCQDSLVKNVIVNPIPFLHVIPRQDTICYNNTINLVAFHNQSISWAPAANIICPTCDTAIAKPLVSTQYICTSTNTFGCSVQDTSNIQVSIPFTATANDADIFICMNESTQVDINPKGKIISWSPANGLSNANIYNPVISPSQNTIYTITLSDSTGCLTNSSKTNLSIRVKSLPVVNAGPDKVYSKGASYSITPTYSNNVNTYLWTPSILLSCNDCATPAGINTHTQQYVIKVKSDSGCVASDSVIISVECKYANIILPTAFTPNNDNLNDYFYPITAGIKTITKFIIYNRAGKVVYEASNFSPNSKILGWNGTYKGVSLSAESYVYTLEAICDLGETLYKRGSITLIR